MHTKNDIAKTKKDRNISNSIQTILNYNCENGKTNRQTEDITNTRVNSYKI